MLNRFILLLPRPTVWGRQRQSCCMWETFWRRCHWTIFPTCHLCLACGHHLFLITHLIQFVKGTVCPAMRIQSLSTDRNTGEVSLRPRLAVRPQTDLKRHYLETFLSCSEGFIFSKQLDISGLQETMIMPNKLYESSSCFFSPFLLVMSEKKFPCTSLEVCCSAFLPWDFKNVL